MNIKYICILSYKEGMPLQIYIVLLRSGKKVEKPSCVQQICSLKPRYLFNSFFFVPTTKDKKRALKQNGAELNTVTSIN